MKNKNTIVTILIVIVILLIGYFLYSKKTISLNKELNQPNQSNAIQNNNDLTKASDELNNTNIDSIDNELNENTNEASSL